MSRSHANDGVNAQHADADVGDVHGAAFTAIAAGGFAIELGHHTVNFDTFCDAVTVAAMRRGDPVGWFQSCADADGTRLLAGVLVDGANRHAGLDKPLETLLEFPDHGHALVHPEQLLAC